MANYNSYDQAYTLDHFSQYDSTICNGEARIPICFCIDTSSSMNFLTNKDSDMEYTGETSYKDGNKVNTVRMKNGVQARTRIDEVQRVLTRMFSRMRTDKRISNAAAVCIVTFDLFADCIVEFSDIWRIGQDTIRRITAGEDHTNASRGIDMALERLDQFRHMNSRAGNESYRPVLIFMSDGSVHQDPYAEQAKSDVIRRVESGNLNVIPIGIGSNFDSRWMRQLSADSRVYRMEHDEEFDKVFEIITRRIERTLMALAVDEAMCETGESTLETTADCDRSTAYGSSIEDPADEFAKWFMDQ